ncbi:MAG TPA: 4Fe-4S dicluster domain-containing protein [Candidatus Saccharimonadales bacterium]|nr:4Fe-4S dicluster domain-containing protein [Candidatus Saccharimonadales bacterium]
MARLNIFLPFFRKRKKTEPSRASPSGVWAPFFSDRETGRKGRIRTALKRLGDTWLSSPWRRVVQASFSLLFVALFIYVCWPYGGTNYAQHREEKEIIASEFFLIIDPLVSLSTAIASKSWVWSLTAAGVILAVCIFIPRGFCGYVCPLGTVIDLFDWAVGRRIKRWKLNDQNRGWWVNLKYYLLVGCLVSSLFGVLLTGFVAAIPVVTRAFLFLIKPLELGVTKGWYLNTGFNSGHVVSIVLFMGILFLGVFRRRFWCQYVCPSGAIFSFGNFFRTTERKVETSCISCNKCVEICPFDAIKPDYTTRTSDCTLCQTCGGVCPTHSIKFVDRWDRSNLKLPDFAAERLPSRRGFLAGMLASGAIAAGVKASAVSGVKHPVRPPGSLPEEQFLQACIRCGECFQACPNDVLQPMGFEQGLKGLWAPRVNANWAGCESSCNNCGQVCPTGAIRALPIEEKRVARIGFAKVESNCLPLAGREACQLCVDECNAAGYHAIEFMRVHPTLDASGNPLDGSGFSAPVVLADKCVGCGLCQTRCNIINVKMKGLIASSAIVVEAGPGKEDRISSGSYLALRERENLTKKPSANANDSYLPEFLKDQ